LHDIQGLSHEEIGKIMECNVGTVRSRLFYAPSSYRRIYRII
jgi:RNA polymerase sigma-70 factor (ECF subfamily)